MKICNTRTTRYFGKNNLVNDLISNTSSCIIKGSMYFEHRGYLHQKEFTFPSAEHYYRAHFLSSEDDIKKLSVDGIFSNFDDGIKLVTEENIEIRDNHIGILMKYLSKKNTFGKRSVSENLGIKMSNDPFEAYGEKHKKSTIVNIWKTVLNNKYYQNPEHRRQLLSTGDDILVEHSDKTTDVGFWHGHVKGGIVLDESRILGGKIVGGNSMGKYMMASRRDMKILSNRPFYDLGLYLSKTTLD